MGRNASSSDASDVGADWLSKADTARRLGKSLTAVTRYQTAGKLTPKVVDGVNYYDPSEVAILVEEIKKSRDQLNHDMPEDDGFALGTMKALVGLIREPREKIDELQFAMLDRAYARIQYLEAELDKRKDAIEAAKDQSLERNLAVKQVESENQIKVMAAGRLLDTVGKLITGWGGSKEGGVSLTPDQLKLLLDANADGGEPFLTPEQVKAAETIVAKNKAAANGKATVQAVADAAASVAKSVVAQ